VSYTDRYTRASSQQRTRLKNLKIGTKPTLGHILSSVPYGICNDLFNIVIVYCYIDIYNKAMKECRKVFDRLEDRCRDKIPDPLDGVLCPLVNVGFLCKLVERKCFSFYSLHMKYYAHFSLRTS
jgi:hypothetical protein